MIAGMLHPLEVKPTDAPYKRETVRSLRNFYEDPRFQKDLDEMIDLKIPYVFVHHVKKRGIYVVDGNHRVGVAHMYGKLFNAIFLNTSKDLSDAYVLRDMKMIPDFDSAENPIGFNILERIPSFSGDLPADHNKAASNGAETFDDFLDMIERGNYIETRPKLIMRM
jgi:hypothetical protein